jgi:hypothetical protein
MTVSKLNEGDAKVYIEQVGFEEVAWSDLISGPYS